jgi:hypothetical protein
MRWTVTVVLIGWLRLHGQQWMQLPDFPGNARDDAAVFTIVDRTYVGTGMDAGFQLTNDWFSFSLSSQTWAPAVALPATGRQYCSGFALEQFGFLFGGVDMNGPLNELWQFDATTGQWTQRAPLPAPGRYASAVIVSDNAAYICGGLLAGGVATNEVWRYDRITNTWSPRAPMPGPARHRASSMYNMVVGGADAADQALNDVLAYDESSDTWSVRPPLPAPRYGSSSAENLLLCGASSSAQYYSGVFVMDPNSGNWNGTLIPDFPAGPRKGGIGAVDINIVDNGIIFYGLGTDGLTRHNDWWMLTYATGMDDPSDRNTTVYPVPATAQIMVTLPLSWTVYGFRIMDNTGRTMAEGRGTAGNAIDVGTLPAGRYELRVVRDGEQLRAPFIKLP